MKLFFWHKANSKPYAAENKIYGTQPEPVTVAQQETGGTPSRSRRPVQQSDRGSAASAGTTTIRIETSDGPGESGDFGGASGGESEVDRCIVPTSRTRIPGIDE